MKPPDKCDREECRKNRILLQDIYDLFEEMRRLTTSMSVCIYDKWKALHKELCNLSWIDRGKND